MYFQRFGLWALLEDISCPPIPAFPGRLTVEKFTGGHPCTQIGSWMRGWRTPRNFPHHSPKARLQKFQSLRLRNSAERPVSKSRGEFLRFSFCREYILSGRDGIGKTCGGAIWISYRPRTLLFPLTEGLGALQRPPPRPAKLQPPCTILNFPLKLSRFCQGPFDLNILSCF